jgi:hypothetical protein
MIVAMERLHGETLDRRVAGELDALDAYFMGTSKIHRAAELLAARLEDAGVDYAIAGALALAVHGFRRATEDVDVLISRDGLERFKQQWLGRGYVELRAGGKPVRDTINDTRIDFLIVGDYPGDGKPKPVSFPSPGQAAVVGNTFRVLALPRLIELKLASAMTAPHRGHDFFDVVELVRRAGLARELADELDAYVRPKYDEAWQLAQIRDDEY